MEHHPLGNTDIVVSDLCFGALPMGPLQANLSVTEGGELILAALQQGVNFIDTAQGYRTYPHIRLALDRFKGEVIIASKSTAVTFTAMTDAVNECLEALGRDYIDIFHIHAAREREPVTSRQDALAALLRQKEEGRIRAVGVACHSAHGISQAATDPRIDIVFPLINHAGLGILDGGVPEMLSAVSTALAHGKGVYAMKALGGGNLLADISTSLDFVRNEARIPIVAVGMVRRVELEMNVALFSGRPVPPEVNSERNGYQKSAIAVPVLCKGCGRCLSYCHNNAITLIDAKAVIDRQKCLLCGYCAPACPQFAIRVI